MRIKTRGWKNVVFLLVLTANKAISGGKRLPFWRGRRQVWMKAVHAWGAIRLKLYSTQKYTQTLIPAKCGTGSSYLQYFILYKATKNIIEKVTSCSASCVTVWIMNMFRKCLDLHFAYFYNSAVNMSRIVHMDSTKRCACWECLYHIANYGL